MIELMNTTNPPVGAPMASLHAPSRIAAQRLRNTLRANVALSLSAGLLAALAPAALDRILDTGHPGWVRLVGIGLLIFACDVAVVAGSRAVRLARWTMAIIAADLMWVAVTVVTISVGWFGAGGSALLGVAALAVGAFAIAQWRHVAALRGGSPEAINESPPIEITSVSCIVDASAAKVWSAITDHELYGRLAPNLSTVAATAPNGPGLTRTCANRTGKEWQETCTLWDEGQRYEIDVDTSDYPYPLTLMRGAWSVEAGDQGAGAIAGMQFAFQPAPGIYGRSFAIAMHAAFPLVLRRILHGWRRSLTLDPR